MAKSPELKVFRGGEYVSSCKYPDLAAAMICAGVVDDVRVGHAGRFVWCGSVDGGGPGLGVSLVADVIAYRIVKDAGNQELPL